MDKDRKERLRVLCQAAGKEQDSDRLMQLIQEIDRLLSADKGEGIRSADLEKVG